MLVHDGPQVHLNDGLWRRGGAIAQCTTGPDILLVAHETGHDPATSLAQNDAHSFFKSVGGQVVTGPTLTNVNDFRAILISPTT